MEHDVAGVGWLTRPAGSPRPGAALARRGGAEGLARVAVQQPAAAGPAGPRADPRDRHLARVLRDPRGAVGDPRPDDADERARRPLPVLPQPALARGVPARGARLGAPAGLRRGRPRPARRPHRRGLRRPRGRRAGARRERPHAPVRPARPQQVAEHARHRRDAAPPPRPGLPDRSRAFGTESCRVRCAVEPRVVGPRAPARPAARRRRGARPRRRAAAGRPSPAASTGARRAPR